MNEIPRPESEQTISIFEHDSRTYGMLCHLLALTMLVGVPLGSIAGPLIVWLLKREQYPFVDQQGKNALNFHITCVIFVVILMILAFITAFSTMVFSEPGMQSNPPPLFFLSFFSLYGIFFVYILLTLIFSITGAVNASKGVSYKYPFGFKFFK